MQKIKLFLGISFLGFLYYVLVSMSVSKSISKDDKYITKLLNVDKECLKLNSYEQEIKCIKTIQESQLNLIKGTACRGKYINLGSKEVINQNTACCFDRSRITEQALQIYGFKVRHVFLIKITSNFLELFKPKTPSHAVTDVFTSKGWLGVDSNESFITISEDGTPYPYRQGIEFGLTKKYSDVDFYDFPTFHIVGIYSRNGKFFKPYLPFFPEINFGDFVYNLHTMKFVFPKEIDN